MKLLSITFKATPRMPGVRANDLTTIDTEKPGDALKGWHLSIRGQQAFFVSPPGWVRDQNVKKRDPDGPVTVFEVPRADMYFEWQGAPEELDALFKNGKWDSPAFGPTLRPATATPPLGIPAHQQGD